MPMLGRNATRMNTNVSICALASKMFTFTAFSFFLLQAVLKACMDKIFFNAGCTMLYSENGEMDARIVQCIFEDLSLLFQTF